MGVMPEPPEGVLPQRARPAGEEDPLGPRLRKLRPIEEKIVRLCYGIGCQRAHSAEEIAGEFGVSRELVGAILEEAERRLVQEGLFRTELRQAGRHRCGAGGFR